MDLKITNDIIIARLNGRDELMICDNRSITEPRDLVTGKVYNIYADIAQYLSFGYFESLGEYMGKQLDEKMLQRLYKYIQTDKFKCEFESTYNEVNDVAGLDKASDECDNLDI